jgi:hypothetical protein
MDMKVHTVPAAVSAMYKFHKLTVLVGDNDMISSRGQRGIGDCLGLLSASRRVQSATAALRTHNCMRVRVQGPNSKIIAQLLGLSVKVQTRLLEDRAAAAAAAAAAQQDGGQQQRQEQATQPAHGQTLQQQQQQVATSILEPCDVRVTVKADEAVQDVSVDVSALQLRMSPDVMQLLLHLQQVGGHKAALGAWETCSAGHASWPGV